MRRKELFDQTCEQLSGIYPAEEAKAIAFVLFEVLLGLDKAQLFLNPGEVEVNLEAFKKALNQLSDHRPLQYVLGEAEFYGLRFKVDENVLIPRPETEELVRWIIDESHSSSPSVLDIGTGSGAIAVSLAKNLPGAKVSGVDISTGALNIARENAVRNKTEVDFFHLDILKQTPVGKFDIVVSNPPYVRLLEKESMRKNVLDHEPGTALFVPDNDPLLFYRRIVEISGGLLNDGGTLYFEINEEFGRETAGLIEKQGFHDVEIRKDIFDKDRMIRGRWR